MSIPHPPPIALGQIPTSCLSYPANLGSNGIFFYPPPGVASLQPQEARGVSRQHGEPHTPMLRRGNSGQRHTADFGSVIRAARAAVDQSDMVSSSRYPRARRCDSAK